MAGVVAGAERILVDREIRRVVRNRVIAKRGRWTQGRGDRVTTDRFAAVPREGSDHVICAKESTGRPGQERVAGAVRLAACGRGYGGGGLSDCEVCRVSRD